MESSTTKAVQISVRKRKELEGKCQNRVNWSDGGNWIGRGFKPNCFISNDFKNSLSHTYSFPTDKSATAWNLEWEKVIRYAGHTGTAALTAGVSILTGGFTGIAVGTIAAIVKDELQASIPYPRMSRGSQFEIIFEYHFKWSPHPWGQRELKQTVTTKAINFEGKVINRSSTSKKYKLTELPDGLGRLLASKSSMKTTSDYN